MVDSFKMKSTETKTCIDFGDGFVDCAAPVRLVAAVSIEKRAGLRVAQLIRANVKPAFIAVVGARLKGKP